MSKVTIIKCQCYVTWIQPIWILSDCWQNIIFDLRNSKIILL
jgi:hypothetical protein